jgi:hypothetical protein
MVRHKKAAQVQGHKPVHAAISLRAVAVDTPKSFATRARLISVRTMPLEPIPVGRILRPDS